MIFIGNVNFTGNPNLVFQEPYPEEFDFDKHFTYGITKKIWDQYGLREEVVERVLDKQRI